MFVASGVTTSIPEILLQLGISVYPLDGGQSTRAENKIQLELCIYSRQSATFCISCRQNTLFGMIGMYKDSLQPVLLAILSSVFYVDSLQYSTT
jgi:hypothetical protein